MDNVLSIKNLSISFGGLKAVNDLTFDIKENEVFGLIGPNGAGKTTVFNCITQFYRADEGELLLKDNRQEVINLGDLAVHQVIEHGIVRTFQNVELIRELTILDNVLIGAHHIYKSSILSQTLNLKKVHAEEAKLKQHATEILEKLQIAHLKDLPAGGQPYGVQKKIELARTLMGKPRLIILDEPAAGLNDRETIELTEIIRDISKNFDCSVFLVEHDMRLVMNVCDRICCINFGKMLAIGNAEEIQSSKLVQQAYLGVDE